MKKPAVILHYLFFANDCASAVINKGMPGLRFVQESIVPECTVKEEIEAEVSRVINNVIDALTRPLTPEEQSPKPKVAERPISRTPFGLLSSTRDSRLFSCAPRSEPMNECISSITMNESEPRSRESSLG